MKKNNNKENLIFLFPILGWLFMQLSALGVFKNFYQANVAAASGGAHFLGGLLSVATVGWVYGMVEDKNFVSKSDILNPIVAFILAALSFGAYAGFVFNVA